MRNKVNCPSCGKEFKLRINLFASYKLSVPKGSSITDRMSSIIQYNEYVFETPLVNCPYCETRFRIDEYRYFGFLKPQHFKYGVLAIILILIFAPVVVLFVKFFT